MRYDRRGVTDTDPVGRSGGERKTPVQHDRATTIRSWSRPGYHTVGVVSCWRWLDRITPRSVDEHTENTDRRSMSGMRERTDDRTSDRKNLAGKQIFKKS